MFVCIVYKGIINYIIAGLRLLVRRCRLEPPWNMWVWYIYLLYHFFSSLYMKNDINTVKIIRLIISKYRRIYLADARNRQELPIRFA